MHVLSRFGLTRIALAIAAVCSVMFGAVPPIEAQGDSRYFAQTRQRIDNEQFWQLYRSRGAHRTFGYPVSGTFTLLGFPVQIYQRQIMQLMPDGRVALMNVLDDGLLPYTAANGSTFPSSDQNLLRQYPSTDDPQYHVKALELVKQLAPDTWDGNPVGFYRAFTGTVKAEDAFPNGGGNSGLLLGMALELWGMPTSAPAYDPTNRNFVYQRFQRGIMHFDKSSGATQGLLLADYVKSILTLQNLPADLDEQAKKSRLYGQFNPKSALSMNRPADLPGSDLTNAFQRGPVVMVDPGHGGNQIGSTAKLGDGPPIAEKELNLKVALRLAELLRAQGIDVIMTRTTDVLVNGDKDLTGDDKVTLTDDLQARVDKANAAGADLLISVHFNGLDDPTRRGTQIFYADERPFSDRSKTLAEMVQTNMIKQLGQAGYQTQDRKATPDSQLLGRGAHFYLLGPESKIIKRASQMPGIIGEPLYLTNAEDAAAIRKPAVQEAVARAYADAVREYFERFPS
ncbi:MAG: N-acetylmuramoyl-L-alanine amidase [Chloroflexota bacterium]